MKKFYLLSIVLIISIIVPFNGSAKKKSKKNDKIAAYAISAQDSLDFAASQASLFSGEWTIVTIKSKKVYTRERAFVNFDSATKRFYGNNGCNTINGSFSVTQPSSISFSDIIATQDVCRNSVTPEKTVMKAFNDAAEFRSFLNNGIMYMQILNSRGGNVMLLKQQNLDFLNGAWTVTCIDGDTLINSKSRIVIDTEELKLHGNSGCNTINGTVVIDPDKDWAIQFQQINSTNTPCSEIDKETSLLVALEEVESCRKIDNNNMQLLDKKGNISVELHRLNLHK
ncbi:MAG: META domain-containing protein [Muribaculaceae bacterium]|jgi:heat shock protein HslJ|nr:META domain-containing protein [Muribaculaceae bacterium]